MSSSGGTSSSSVSAAGLALARKLRAGVDGANVLILGDSTANGPTEWFQKAMTALAGQYPACRVASRLWNDASQSYDPPTVLQAGAGVARGLYATVSNGAYITTPDTAAVSVTGDLEIHVKAAANDWTPAVAFELCGKSGSAPQVGWFLRLNTDGTLILYWSIDGTAVSNLTSTVATGFADGATRWIRVTLDVDNGAAGRTATFYTSVDGAAWTILGAPVTAGGVTAIYDNTAALTLIGRIASGGGINGAMTAYRLRVFNGLGGTLVADADVTDMVNAQTPWADSVGAVWTPSTITATGAGEASGTPTLALYNASMVGAAIAYSNDPTRFAKQTAQQSMDLAFINYSHNDGTLTAYRAPYKQLADALLAKYPDCGVVASTQNPQTAPRTAGQIAAHASRQAVIRALAASQRYSLVDAFNAFAPANLPALVLDGLHPTQAGEDLWAAQVSLLFG